MGTSRVPKIKYPSQAPLDRFKYLIPEPVVKLDWFSSPLVHPPYFQEVSDATPLSANVIVQKPQSEYHWPSIMGGSL